LRENGIPLRHRYSLFAGTNEENGMADIRYYCQKYDCPTLNLVPDSGFPVCIAERGNCMIRVYTPPLDAFSGWQITCNPLPGLAADSTEALIPGQKRIAVTGEALRLSERNPDQPIAPELLLKKLVQQTDGDTRQALQALLRVAGDPYGNHLGIACEDTQSGKLHGSAGRIGMENGCVFMELTITLPICTRVDTLQQTIEAGCAKEGLSARIIKLRAPHSFPAGHPVVKRLTEVYQDATGYKGEPFVMSGGSYAGQLPRAFAYGPGMPGRVFPADIFRPGCGDYHQVDESEDIEHLCLFTQVYIHALLALNDMEFQFEGEQA
jgi:succinyl-diaminopimelate desuccinylase